MNMIDEALSYADNGWCVLPLAGKVPLTPHGVTDASADLERIRSWWSCWPDANIGASVPANLLVLDIDPRNGGDVADLGALPSTLTCWSGRGDGGRHLYFLRPHGPTTSTRLPAGIDLKVSGYCVVPPSVHPEAVGVYEWEHHPVAQVPAHLRELLRPAPRRHHQQHVRGRRGGAGRHLLEFVAAQPWGNVNRGLHWAACRAADDGLLDDLADALVTAAVVAGHPEPGARRTVESARKTVGAG